MVSSFGGYTGCLRGLSVGGKILDLISKGADGTARGKLKVLLFITSSPMLVTLILRSMPAFAYHLKLS